MKKFKTSKIYLIIILIFIFFKESPLFRNIYKDENFEKFINLKDEISIIINMKNLTKKKHNLFYDIIKQFNSTRNFYFIKNIGKPLNENLNNLVQNSSVKIVQSNFPDTFFLPLVVSLYGNTIPELVLFIEGEELTKNSETTLIKWAANAYKKIMRYNYDYIFGNFQINKGKKIGCSLLFSKASIIEHLLYYTDSDTSHSNPFIQLSFATQTKFLFIKFKYIKSSNLENKNNRISRDMNCPSTDDKNMPSFCIILPTFKRNYFNSSFTAFSNQTYKPKFYIIIQNENRMIYNLSIIQKIVNEPVYHIWMQNWNSFFFLNHRLSSVFPCDFILKYDDDQWPIDNSIQKRLISTARGKNIIIGLRGFTVPKSFCGYSPKNYTNIKDRIVDHSAVPLLARPGYIKLEARNSVYRLYGGEDIALSLNSRKLCNVTSIIMEMKLMEKQNDGNNQRADKQIISAYEEDKETNFELFSKTYCYLIRSGYKPRKWAEFQIPQEHYINTTINLKRIN